MDIETPEFQAKPLRTRLRVLAAVSAILITVAIPACYLAVVYFAQMEALRFQAKLSAGNLSRYVYATGSLWIFHAHRLDGLLSATQNTELASTQTIHSADGALIHRQGVECRAPSLVTADDIVVIGSAAGRVEVCKSFSPFLLTAVLLLMCSGGLGALTFFTVQRLPISALDRTLAELARAYRHLRKQSDETTHAYKLLQGQQQKVEEQAMALAEARDEAQAANKAKTDFLAHMSHELRTPLNAIIGFSDMMKTELLGPLPGRYKEYATDINESGTHLLILVDDILDVSRIETGRVELVLVPQDLCAIVRVSMRMVRERALKSRVTLEEDLGAAPVVIQADLTRLKQVFLNLLANAIRFTPPGGLVTVSVRTHGHRAIVTVRDTGVGMNASEAALNFGHHDALVSAGIRPEGSGLGLPISRSLVRLHGGTLFIESAPGAGTCVTVELPLAEAALRSAS